MYNIKVKCFPSGYGDSFLITIHEDDRKYNILIDCGLKNTYRSYIKKELECIKKIDLLVLTHIDDDHIGGAVELFKDYKMINDIDIRNIWFNDLYKITKGKFKQNLDLSRQEEDSKSNVFDEDVGYRSAKNLANYILESKHRNVWNVDETVIQCERNLYKEIYPINDSIKFVLLSPYCERINELFDDWCSELDIDSTNLVVDNNSINKFYSYFMNSEVINKVFDEDCCIEEVNIEELAELEYNKSNSTNNASIAFFIEVGEKRLLFLGDSNSNDIKESLEKYIKDKKLQKIRFDLVKLSHHGSKNNITSEFFSLFRSDTYLVSSNGKRYNHPDIECLCKVIVKQSEFKKILFNYNIGEVLRDLDNKEFKDKYKYDLIMPNSSEEDKVLNIDI